METIVPCGAKCRSFLCNGAGMATIVEDEQDSHGGRGGHAIHQDGRLGATCSARCRRRYGSAGRTSLWCPLVPRLGRGREPPDPRSISGLARKTSYPVRVHVSVVGGVPYYLVESSRSSTGPAYTWPRSGDFADNHVRYAVLSRAAWRSRGGSSVPIFCTVTTYGTGGPRPGLPSQCFGGRPGLPGVKVLLSPSTPRLPGIVSASALGQMGWIPPYSISTGSSSSAK